MLSFRQVRREAAIIARRLAKQKGWLAPIQNGLDQADWYLVNPKTSRPRPSAKISQNLVLAMQEQGWIKADPTGNWILSASGMSVLLPAQPDQPFVRQHQLRETATIKDMDGIARSVCVNQTESPLGWMRARKDKNGKPMLSDAQFQAGERLRADFTLAQMSPRITSNWDFSNVVTAGRRKGGAAGIEISERAMAARQRLTAAFDLLGDDMSNIVFDVCCLASGLEAAEKRLGWPRRSGKLVLQIALSRLAVHYGITSISVERTGPAIIRKWATQGYRPRIPAATSGDRQA